MMSLLVTPHRYTRHGFKGYVALALLCLVIASTMGTPA